MSEFLATIGAALATLLLGVAIATSLVLFARWALNLFVVVLYL